MQKSCYDYELEIENLNALSYNDNYNCDMILINFYSERQLMSANQRVM